MKQCAGDLERDDDPVADGHFRHFAADLLDDPHRLVPEDVTLAHEGAERCVQVQVGGGQLWPPGSTAQIRGSFGLLGST